MIEEVMHILLLVSAPAYMCPSPRDKDYISVLKKAGLKVPSLDIENDSIYLRAAHQFSRRAKDLFRGYFKKILEGIKVAKSHGIKIDLYFLSPRYGIIEENEVILPYLADLKGLKKKEIETLRNKLRIDERLSNLLQQPYDTIILILKKEHMPLLGMPEIIKSFLSATPKVVLISAPSLAKLFTEPVKFVGVRQTGKRAVTFVKIVDSLTSRTLEDYFK